MNVCRYSSRVGGVQATCGQVGPGGWELAVTRKNLRCPPACGASPVFLLARNCFTLSFTSTCSRCMPLNMSPTTFRHTTLFDSCYRRQAKTTSGDADSDSDDRKRPSSIAKCCDAEMWRTCIALHALNQHRVSKISRRIAPAGQAPAAQLGVNFGLH